PAPTESASASPPAPINLTPSTPPPPPPPQKVTIPSGTTLAVRLVDTIDSERSQPGQTFHATLDSPLAVEGDVAVPAGYDVEGHIVDVKSAGKFAGQSVLALQLDRIKVGDKYYNVQTDQYRRQGSSRGKNTAEKVGAGAGIGAIIGAIAGGGKGAASGATASEARDSACPADSGSISIGGRRSTVPRMGRSQPFCGKATKFCSTHRVSINLRWRGVRT